MDAVAARGPRAATYAALLHAGDAGDRGGNAGRKNNGVPADEGMMRAALPESSCGGTGGAAGRRSRKTERERDGQRQLLAAPVIGTGR